MNWIIWEYEYGNDNIFKQIERFIFRNISFWFLDFPKNCCKQRTLRLNEPLNTCTANEICRVYAFPILFRENRFVRWKRSIVSRNMAIIRRCFRILLGNKRPRARAQMHGYTVYQFAIQSSRSLECSLKLFHPNLVFTSFAQFRMDVYTYMYIFTIYACVYVPVHIYIYISVSNFSFPEESAYPPRKETRLPRNRDSSSPWSRLRWDVENKRMNGIEMEGRYTQSN